MLRSRHDTIVAALAANLDVRAELISTQKAVIALRDAEIKALKLTLEGKKCNDYTSEAPEKPKRPDPVMPSRSGWRARAQMMSDATIPIKDSAKALEEKVKREGGTV
jgi:phage terminase small subunit